MTIVRPCTTPFRASHVEEIADIPRAHSFEGHPSATLWSPHGRVIACYGCVLASPGRGVLWLVPGPDAGRWRRALLASLVRHLHQVIEAQGLWRVEMVVNPCNDAAVRLVEHLEFTWEARLYGYGPQGQPFDQYAWVREKERDHVR